MRFRNSLVISAIGGLLLLPLIAMFVSAASVDADWRTSENGLISFAGYGYGGARPDAQIRVGNSGAFAGANVYNANGTGQKASKNVGRGGAANFQIRLDNDAFFTERLRVAGPGSNSRFTISYFLGNTNITSKVVAGTYRTNPIPGQASITIKMVVKAKPAAPRGATITAKVTVRSNTTPATLDVVKGKVTRI